MFCSNIAKPYHLLVFLFLALAWPAQARASQRDEPPRKWWTSESVKAEVGLTDDQSARIEALFQESFPLLRAAKQELDECEEVLSKLLGDAATDEAQVSAAVDRVEAARGRLSKGRTLMLFRMHRVLSADQRVKLKALRERHDQEHSRPRDTARYPQPHS